MPEIPPQDFSSLRRLPSEADLSQVLRNINSGNLTGGAYNCANCALAFEMVMRGYDVKARPMPDGTNVGNIDYYIVDGNLLHVPYVMSEELKHTYRVADNYRHRYWAMLRKHRKADKNWRVNKKLRVSLERYFDVLDEERNRLYDDITADMIQHKFFGKRGIMILGVMEDMNPTNSPRIYHAINYVVRQNEVDFYDTQNYKHLQENDPLKHINPHEVYVMRTDDKEISPRITECVYSDS